MHAIELTSEQLKALARDPLIFIRDSLSSLPKKPDFYLYGAGNLGRKMARGLAAQGAVVKGFLDNNPKKVGQIVEGLPVLALDNLSLTENSVCVITIWHYRHNPAESAKHANSLGFQNIFHFASIAALFGIAEVLPNYAVDHPSVLFNDDTKGRLLNTARFLSDEPSRHVLSEVISFHALPSPSRAPKISFRPLPFQPEKVVTYIDGGAFVGDDFESHLKDFSELKQALLVEPDPQSFATLKNRQFPKHIEISPVHAALSQSKGHITFQANGDWGSKVVEGSEIPNGLRIPCVTLDSLGKLFLFSGPVYIKMDLEGHEIAALKGAQELLRRNNVIFSITLEHRALDLFEVPEFLMSFPGRSHFLYPHDSEFSMDLVLYSVPDALISTTVGAP
jgi:FkbM family methyltransferase